MPLQRELALQFCLAGCALQGGIVACVGIFAGGGLREIVEKRSKLATSGRARSTRRACIELGDIEVAVGEVLAEAIERGRTFWSANTMSGLSVT